MEAKDLSKQKYIYKVYTNDNHEIHCEKYPVVYANKERVYFKDSGPDLDSTITSNIRDELTVNDIVNWRTFYWKVDESLISDLQRNYRINKMRSDLKVLAGQVTRTAYNYQQVIAAYNKMAEALKKLEAENEESKLL